MIVLNSSASRFKVEWMRVGKGSDFATRMGPTESRKRETERETGDEVNLN
jgi:hypothetical protein